MLARGIGPFAEPRPQRIEQRNRSGRVLFEDRPLIGVGPTLLVQDRRGHFELADVVHEPCPVQPIQVVLGQVEFFTDHQRVGADPFGVTTSHAIVRVQRSRQGHQPFRRLLEVGLVELTGFQRALQLAQRVRPHRNLESRRCVIGKHQRQPEQGHQRQRPAQHPFGRHQDHRRRQRQTNPPANDAVPGFGAGHDAACDCDETDRHCDRRQHDDQLQQTPQHWPFRPLTAIRPRILDTGRPGVRARWRDQIHRDQSALRQPELNDPATQSPLEFVADTSRGSLAEARVLALPGRVSFAQGVTITPQSP